MTETGSGQIDQLENRTGDRQSTTMPNTSENELRQELATMQERLRVIWELSLHVWPENRSRNFGLLNKIHGYAAWWEGTDASPEKENGNG